jgi:hypothetical protein
LLSFSKGWEVAAVTMHGSRIDEHPDLVALRIGSERAVTRPAAQAVECLSLLAGLYLAISPWVVGFDAFRSLTVSNLVTGLALVVLALGYGPAYERTHGMSWAALLVGAWTIVAPWVVAGHAAATKPEVSNVIAGAAACLTALATMGLGMAGGRTMPVPRELP